MDSDQGELLADRYQLTSLLGQGGMGAVWRAYDQRLGRDVAVKELRLPEHVAAEERATWMARLDREARAAARLKHPGIVTVHDRITGADGRPWIVMELVAGGSLDDLLRQGPLPPERVADLGRQVAAALDAAHRAGITHRDIKPANILLEDGRAVLTDFGIAGLEGDAALTATGVIMGTPAFMAPEQVRGLPATAASDLWSLGATLYTAVEGHPPFTGATSSAVLVAVATDPPTPVVRAGPLTPVLAGLLHKEPDQRLTMERLRTQLDQVPGTASPGAEPPADPSRWPTAPARPPATPPPPAATPAPARRRIPRWAAWAGAGVVAVVVSSLLAPDSGDASYQDNRAAAEALGHPPDFTIVSKERAGGDQARVRYSGGPVTGDPSTGQWNNMASWMEERPGVENAAIPTVNPDCMTNDVGCVWGVERIDGYSEPTILRARTYAEDGILLLEIEVGARD
ncbi:serine/threonine-protein kinase [Streptomyces sp. DSM 44915]|uniref:non-specific serine/threonine protein kinase n=1 Tax=Streptomyces chisholmiae TaxID=3075540 RepID=A0ABU2JWJ3_9ACTN|nr:serine/threonine-protein kinase [Streptomyces sp. DSM 44915]MDT0269227.1 serine/threonine-protein kinase [Streptomyces sp. DSM 44915]